MPRKNPEARKKYMAEYRERTRQKARDYAMEYRIKQDNSRAWAYKNFYNFTVKEYEEMLEAQGGVCALCFKVETATKNGKVKRLAVDHCHNSNKVRGLLCMKCNTYLGKFNDEVDYFQRVIDYLLSNKQ
jgi:hypothetical protein